MPIGLQIKNKKFKNSLYNGTSFSLNPSNYTTDFKGNVGDYMQFSCEIGLYWEKELTSYSVVSGGGVTTINMDGANFITDCGFSLGDNVQYGKPVETSPGSGVWGLTTFEGTIQYLDDNKMDILVTGGAPPTDGWQDGNTSNPYYAHVITAISSGSFNPNNMFYSFCINENDDAFSEYSIIDQTLQSWYVENIGATNTEGIWKDTLKSAKSGGFRAKTLSAEPRNIRWFNVNNVFRYQIEHEFIVPYWSEDDLENIQSSIPISDLNGEKSYKYAFKIDIRTILGNATTSKKAIFETDKGSIGYFDESFNGFSEYYYIDSFQITDNSNSGLVDGLVINSNCSVFAVLKSTKANFTNTSVISLMHSILPNYSDYAKNKNTLVYNHAYDTKRVVCNSPVVNSTYLYNCGATFVDASTININFDVEYDTQTKERLTDDLPFILAVDVSDENNIDASDKIKLKITSNFLQKNSDVYGLIDSVYSGFCPHDKTYITDLDTFSDFKGFIEDGIYFTCRFNLLNTVETISSARFKIIALDNTTNDEFELFGEDVDVSGLIKTPTGHYINYVRELGYNLPNNQFNRERFYYDVPFASGSGLRYQRGVKIPYQTWIENLNASIEFFDSAKENNNLNYNTSNYDTNGYKIYSVLDMEVVDSATLSTTSYRIKSNEMIIKDFDESADYSCDISTFTEADFDLSGLLLNGQDTVIKAEFSKTSGTFDDLTGYWGIIRIEKQNEQFTNNHELSTIAPTYVGNLLQPLTGQSGVKMEIVSGNVVLSCKTDSRLMEKENYRISARLEKTDEIIELGAYSNGYSDGYN